MKKPLIAVPLVLVGVAAAGAWYTGTQVEQEVNRGIAETNELFTQEIPQFDASLSLAEIDRGWFSTTARYHLTFTLEEGEEPKTLVFADRLEHGPFPVSRLMSGRLAPVMAQSHFALEENEFTAPLFAAAGGKAPLFGELTLSYSREQDAVIETAPLDMVEGGDRLRVSPARLAYSASAEMKEITLEATLGEVDLTFTDESSGKLGLMRMRDLGIQGNKAENSNGFALGPSVATIKHITIQAPGTPEIELRNASFSEALVQGDKGLDQNVSYKVDTIMANGKTLGSARLDLGLRNLDEKVLTELRDLVKGMDPEGDELTSEQEESLKRVGLELLKGSPVIALDELSFKTTRGLAKASLSLDLRHPDESASSIEDIVRSLLAALKAEVKVDKALIGDIVALQSTLNAEGEAVDPLMLKQQADAMSELFSGVALQSQWAVLDGNTLSSTLSYANDQITLNGKTMTVPQFMAFAMSAAQGLGNN